MNTVKNITEITCPNCGETIVLDETAYKSVAQQVRDHEFNSAVQDAKERFERELTAMKATHKAQLDALAARKDAERQALQTETEQEIATVYADADIKVGQAQAVAAIAKAEKESAIAQAEESLKASQKLAAQEKISAVVEAKAQTAKVYSERIAQLEAQVRSSEAERKLSVSEEQQRAQTSITAKEREIDALRHQLEQQKSEHALALDARDREHALALRQKDEEIEFYKDFKLRQSTKMLGETLEQHCLTAFEQVRHIGFPHAYFEKDNDASNGSKGDFIFRDFDEHGVEYISVMFEMKNEADDTAHKHKNEDFFKKLDADRKAKGCEYAVLVSTLEGDNDRYNAGIVDVSHRYPKMYVVRPQFFIPLLTLLRNAAANSLAYREEVEMLRNQHFDVQQFAGKLNEFKTKFGKSYGAASKQLETAVDEIDKTIAHLEKTKRALLSSAKHLENANNKAEDMTLKRLTRGNPTMQRKFKDAGIDAGKTDAALSALNPESKAKTA